VIQTSEYREIRSEVENILDNTIHEKKKKVREKENTSTRNDKENKQCWIA
jgi:hypothetical protein